MLNSGTPLPAGARALLAWWRARGVVVRDAFLTALLVAAAFAPGLVDNGVRVGELPQRALDAPGVVLVLGQCLPLVVRRHWPAACLVVVAGCFSTVQLLAYPSTFASVGILVALYSAGAHQDRHRYVLGATATAGYALLTVALHGRGSPEQLADYLAFYLVLLACAGVGALLRSWQAAEAERHRRTAELAVAHERSTIARELHDVVTHHVTAMVVQADAARFLPTEKHDELTTGLRVISDTGRQAMTDLRQLLSLLDTTDVPAAGEGQRRDHPERPHTAELDRVDDLVERVQGAGQPVELTIEGERPPMAAGVERAAHRVVQEALTNAVKHARGRRTTVLIEYSDDSIGIDVTTEGRNPPSIAAPPVPSGGRGLTGLRERVRVFGGEFTAGDRPEGGFAVRARLPLGRAT